MNGKHGLGESDLNADSFKSFSSITSWLLSQFLFAKLVFRKQILPLYPPIKKILKAFIAGVY